MKENSPSREYIEGKVKIKVFEGVFYNPYTKFSRDISCAFLNVFFMKNKRPLYVCDPLAATGVRGIRYAIEVKGVENVVINDIQPLAYTNILANVKINNVESKTTVTNKDANLLLHEYRITNRPFDIIDIDPFGSPAPYMDSSFKAIRHEGVICFTATDVAPLCGSYGKSSLRRYHVQVHRTEYCHEVAIRTLIGFTARIAGLNEAAIVPLLTHATRHYIRAFLQVKKTRSLANMIVKEMGYISHCPNCLWRSWIKGLTPPLDRVCPMCNREVLVLGPLWLGRIIDNWYAKNILPLIEQYNLSKREIKMVEVLAEESDAPPTYYNLDQLASKIGISSPPVRKVIERLREVGYFASRTHFNPKSIKTDAPYEDLIKVIKATF